LFVIIILFNWQTYNLFDMKPLKVNRLAVALCVVIAMLGSFLWYTLFEESWMQANELNYDFVDGHRNSGPFAIGIIANFITFSVMAWFFTRLNVRSAARGVTIAMLMAIAFYFVVQYSNNAFSFRSKTLSFIDGGLIIINWMIAGAVLGSWKKYKTDKS
jgi:hypothetical protein